MDLTLKKEGNFEFMEVGTGETIILLHGLMGALSNFTQTTEHLVANGYKVVLPVLPIYDLPLLKTNAKHIAKFLESFITFKGYTDITLVGNSLGGHVGLIYAKNNPESVKRLVLTGSSGLYENAMGGSFPRREDYNYIKTKTEDVFFNKEIATKELVDEVYSTLNSRVKVLKILAIAKSAIRHNMAKDLPNIQIPTYLVWGKNDNVTPPEVAEEFNTLMPNSTLDWIDECGHAAMMEKPEEFSTLLTEWLSKTKLA